MATAPAPRRSAAPIAFAGMLRHRARVDALTAFGLFAVSFMLLCYVLEDRSHWWQLGFALGCLLGSAYGFLQGAWPFGAVELIWFAVAGKRWVARFRTKSSVA